MSYELGVMNYGLWIAQ